MNTEGRFRFNMSHQDALDLITAFYCAEINIRHQSLKLDQPSIQNLLQLSKIITDKNPRFGIMFCGAVGNGKTTLMKAFQKCINYLDNNNHFCFLDDVKYGRKFKAEMRIVDVRDIIKSAKDDASSYDILRKIKILGIDDLGKEPAEILDYGNVLSPVIELLEYRYEKQLFTVITTNLIGKEIREKYGERIADRFNEMLSLVVFRNQSYR